MIDEIDQDIILELRRDGRRSCAGVAKGAGISESAARQRIRQLLGSGVVRVVAVADPHRFGLARRARIGICCTGDTTKLADRLAGLSAVSHVVLTAGSFDVVIEVDCVDDDALLDLISNELRVLPGVLSTETMVCLKVFKNHGRGVHADAGGTDVVVTRAPLQPPLRRS
ncbi:Lrp/AsnC family transcriptional regulator [Mycobacterium sp. 21AC1]|uniref:Lrp/AsnC family transcriptional regulator n=1 Tax=[Mycobacterium] appelbergii TaxID=2939269 RepID=UPI002938F7BD|nr:Lrp/AsnC family transcriptional regulator [Mycobacterium sp. 21AC1]MDV3128421.1 Lrp/AsnC family transcriptional regulator [Mycobacterium sp. 21AC1]